MLLRAAGGAEGRWVWGPAGEWMCPLLYCDLFPTPDTDCWVPGHGVPAETQQGTVFGCKILPVHGLGQQARALPVVLKAHTFAPATLSVAF